MTVIDTDKACDGEIRGVEHQELDRSKVKVIMWHWSAIGKYLRESKITSVSTQIYVFFIFIGECSDIK